MSINIKFSDYSIDHIKDYVDNKLFKTKRLDVVTIKDLIELDVDFSKIKEVLVKMLLTY